MPVRAVLELPAQREQRIFAEPRPHQLQRDGKAARESAPRGPSGPTAREARVPPRKAGSPERGAIVGALIEYPELLEDPAVQACLSLLEGDSAQTVAALAKSLVPAPAGRPSHPVHDALQTPGQPAGKEHAQDHAPSAQKSLDTSSFLAQIPPPIQAFASERLAAPRHENREDAKGHLLDNADKLRKLILGRETSDLAKETYRALGDWQAETELALEAQERAKERLGLGRGH